MATKKSEPKQNDKASDQSIVGRLCRAFGVTIRVADGTTFNDVALREIVTDIVDVSGQKRRVEVGDTAIGKIRNRLIRDRVDLNIELTQEIEDAIECGAVCQIRSYGYVTNEDGKKHNGNLVLMPGDGIDWKSVVRPANQDR